MSDKHPYFRHLEQAKALLKRYQRGDSAAIKTLKELHPGGEKSDFSPTLQDARLVICAENMRVNSLSLDKLKKDAKDFLKLILGDIMFLYAIRGLWENTPAALCVQAHTKTAAPLFRELLSITEIGKQLLAGQLNWMDMSSRERWVGGVHLQSQQQNWYWSAVEGRPVYQ